MTALDVLAETLLTLASMGLAALGMLVLFGARGDR